MTVVQKIEKKGITKKDRWFDPKPKFKLFTSYYQSPLPVNPICMKRFSFHTIHIDLLKSKELLLAEMDKGTSYEIRRAEKEGIQIREVYDLNVFVDFFNEFALNKKIDLTSLNYLNFEPQIRITQAVLNEEPLVMHSYIVDSYRCRLMMSASKVISETELIKKYKPIIGFANRFLHFQDMLLFKSEGKEIYDFGGYANNTGDAGLAGINKFKLGFGGLVKEEFNYRPFWLP
jgi:hypothetical protein